MKEGEKMRYDYLINQVLAKVNEVEIDILFQNWSELDKK